MRDEVSIPQLRSFIAVVEAGSVAKAARRLAMSAASVSKAISRLEESAGVRLMNRSTHALSLTDAGEALLVRAREAVSAADAFVEAASHASSHGDAGIVRLTAPVGMVRHVIAPLTGELARLHPDIHLDVRVTYDHLDLAEGAIDLALSSGPFAGLSGHVRQPWFASPWVLCAAPAYLKGRGRLKAIADLDQHELVAFRFPRSGRVEPWPLRDGSYEPKARTTFDDGEAAWGATLAGAGITCIPLYMAANALRKRAVVEILPDFRDDPVPIAMLRRNRRLTPSRLTKVMTFLSANAPDLSDLL